MIEWLEYGLSKNFDVYNDMVTQLIKDADGDPIKEKEIADTLREVILDMNVLTLEQVEEEITAYEKFVISDQFRRFLDVSRRFIRAVAKKPNMMAEWLCFYSDEAKKLWHSGDEAGTVIILGFVLDYLNGVERDNKATIK